MIQKLDRIYSTKSLQNHQITAMQILCRNKLKEFKLKNYERVDEFFADFKKAVNKFKAAGGKIEEAEKMRYLIKSLPSNYSYIGDFIDVIPEDQRTVDDVKSKIKEKNMNKTDNSEKKSKVSTFSTKTKGKCYSCGQFEHYQTDCKQDSSGCRGTKRRSSQRGFGQGQRGRGRGTFRPGGVPKSTEAESSAAWATQVNSSQTNQGTIDDHREDSETELNCLLDSGCTDHIVKNDKFFDKFVKLKIPIVVKLPDGKLLKATKIGSITLNFKNYYSTSKVEISNVYFVQVIKQNLSLEDTKELYRSSKER